MVQGDEALTTRELMDKYGWALCCDDRSRAVSDDEVDKYVTPEVSEAIDRGLRGAGLL